MVRARWILALVIGLSVPAAVSAATYDVGIMHAGITFSPSPFFVGDRVRIYSLVKNLGDRDVEGNVFVSENGTAIATPPPFSAKARGAEEEVWVEWQPATVGDRQIFVRVVSAPEMRDEDLTNNEMIVPVFVDRDTDGDRIGDREDPDDDNDGLPDAWEVAHGLNPTDARDANADPDGDGRSTIDEYRVGTDPFTAQAPVRGGGVFGGGGGSGSATPAASPSNPAAVAVAPVRAGAPVGGTVTSPERPVVPPRAPTGVAGTKIRSPGSVGGKVTMPAPTTTESTIATATTDRVPASDAPAPPPPLRWDLALRQLLGTGGGRWTVMVSAVAGGVALLAFIAAIVLLCRRRLLRSRSLAAGHPPETHR